ncbi:MAG: acyl-CoA carboxylase subunit epsilon, partial [Paenarthrobacter sp.]
MSTPKHCADSAPDAAPTEPLFSVVKGEPTSEELAAIAAVVVSL